MAGLEGVGYVNGYCGYVNFGDKTQRKNPFQYPENPGLIFPEQEKKNNTAKIATAVAGVGIAAVLAFLFRGKIKTGATKALETVKPYVKNALTKGKELVKKGVDFAKPYLTKAKDAVTGLGTKVVNFFKKAPAQTV